MSDAFWLALFALFATFIGSLPALMTAHAGLQQSKKNAEKTEENTVLTAATSKKVTDAAAQIKEVGKQTTEIHAAANGTLTKLEEKFAASNQENQELRAMIKTLLDRQSSVIPAHENLIEKRMTESQELNRNMADFMKEFASLTKEMKVTQETVKTMLDERAHMKTGEISEITALKNIMADFAKTGMPVIAPEGEPLPVKVEAVVKK